MEREIAGKCRGFARWDAVSREAVRVSNSAPRVVGVRPWVWTPDALGQEQQAGQKDERIVQTLGRNTALAADALAVHDRLWGREGIGPHRIVVLGHSLSCEDSVQLGANRYVRFAMRFDPGLVKVDVRLA